MELEESLNLSCEKPEFSHPLYLDNLTSAIGHSAQW